MAHLRVFLYIIFYSIFRGASDPPLHSVHTGVLYYFFENFSKNDGIVRTTFKMNI